MLRNNWPDGPGEVHAGGSPAVAENSLRHGQAAGRSLIHLQNIVEK